MSYDLYFWRQSSDVKLSPSKMVDMLSKDQPVEGIASFPRELVRRILKESFPDIEDGDAELSWEGDGSYFQITFGHPSDKDVHLIVASCGYQLLDHPETVNRLIESCTNLGCALYDPQVNKRFAQSEPKIR